MKHFRDKKYFGAYVCSPSSNFFSSSDTGYLNWVTYFTDGTSDVIAEERRGKNWKYESCYAKLFTKVDIQNTQINGWDGFMWVEREGVIEPSLTCTNACDCLNGTCDITPTTKISVDGNNNTWYSSNRPVVCIESAVCSFQLTSM